MKNIHRIAAAAIAFAAAQGEALAQAAFPRAPTIPLACSLANLTPVEQKLADATAYLVPKTFVTINRNGSYNIQTSLLDGLAGLDANDNPIVHPFDPDSQFYGGPSIGSSAYGGRGRTAVLIGSNLFVSAAHTFGFDPANFYVVFLPTDFGCSLSSLSSVPADLVYDPAGASTLPINTLSSGRNADYIAFRVDRVVTGRKPVKLRRSDAPRFDDPLVLIGHPMWSGKRVERGGHVFGIAPPGSIIAGRYRFEGLHPFEGSSGSAIYNLKDEVIETVISSNINGSLYYHLDAYNNQTVYDASNFGHSLQAYGDTNANAISVSDLIPRMEVSVTPITDVLHVAPLGGTLSQTVSSYNILGGLGSNQYEVIAPPAPASDAPTLTSNIPPGDRVTGLFNPHVLDLTAGIANVSSCGIWDYTYNVRDRYNEQNNYLRHRFEIGVEEVSISPLANTDILDLGTPYAQGNSYTVTNPRPTVTQLIVRVLETNGNGVLPNHWLRVNGATVLPVTLQAAGTPGDSVTLNLDVTTPPTSQASSQLRVDFVNPACTIQAWEDLVRVVNVTTGTQVFDDEASGNDLVKPTSTTYGTPETFSFDLSAESGLCVSDVDVAVDFFDSEFNTIYSSPPEATPLLKMVLRAPSGTAHTLWEGQATPSQSYVSRHLIEAFGMEFPSKRFTLDDQSTPPASTLLSGFNGEDVEGVWQLDVSRSGTAQEIAPLRAELKLSAAGCP